MSYVRRSATAREFRRLGLGVSMLGLLALSGCSIFDSDSSNVPPPPPYMPVEFAMPAGSTIDRGDTNVVGDNMNWYGTLALTSDTDMDDAHQFYAHEMPREGWEPLSVLVADRVVLQFVSRRRGRAAIVTIGSRTALGGSHIEVMMSPLVGEHSEVSETEQPRPRPDR
jgi:hypothetical protein